MARGERNNAASTQHQRSTNAASTQHQRSINAASTQHQRSINAASTQHQRSINAASTQHQRSINAASTQHQRSINAASTQHQRSINAASTQHQRSINAASTQHQRSGHLIATAGSSSSRLSREMAARYASDATQFLTAGMFLSGVPVRGQHISCFSFASVAGSAARATRPALSSSAAHCAGGTKKSVANEFQCFLFLRASDAKSSEMRCRWSCRIDGTEWNPASMGESDGICSASRSDLHSPE
eukprot:CAMPEP_0181232360 /NCGR_PEP_ID=MMETSP1096-20121128/35685_1 /TAXON_ID=156174 ORGANISM="Chrysochromulina ericina, Strain CCMP281" /NCGR_SAMPLE_ID=MMETSP1096 /ASSEMBLY_ACC=CAM_ASM_000453 /LENGTH=242 /DNA_ID=CAMNT_0023326637 /DNA_START=250 /DNA_END=978 /DNA_ORIENTATION=-